MDRLRFVYPVLLALTLSVLVGPAARAQDRPGPKTDSEGRTCVTYSLAELGGDADLGKWVAETIPEVIAPGTWKGQGVLRYYGPKNLLVVYHTPATHAKVDAFLQSVKKSLPAGNDRVSTPMAVLTGGAAVVQADFRAPGTVRRTASPEQSLSYPVPAPATRPKHLFHFIIRYEGEGIVDDNVVKAFKTQVQANKKDKADVEKSRSPCCCQATPATGSAGPATTPPGSALSVPSTAPEKVKNNAEKGADKENK